MENRIYVVVAETVFTPEKGVVRQIAGRMAAQACHAASRMKMHRLASLACQHKSKHAPEFRELLHDAANAEVTTIILSCRDSNELEHVHRLLTKARVKHYDFKDSNEPVYGAGKFRTALATVPVMPEAVVNILDYLPLWTPPSA